MNSDEPTNNRNLRDEHAEKLKPSTDNDQTAKFPDTGDAGDRPREPFGLTEAASEPTEAVRTSEAVNPPDAEPAEDAFVDKTVLDQRTL